MSGLRAEQAREITEEVKKREARSREEARLQKELESEEYADKHFKKTLNKILKRIQEAASNPYNKNGIDLGISVQEDSYGKRNLWDYILACKVIYELNILGYKIEQITRVETHPHPDTDWGGDEYNVIEWKVKW